MKPNQLGAAAPTIIHATFQAAIHSDRLSGEARRRLRADWRHQWLPPGLIRPRWAVERAFCYEVGPIGSGDVHIVPAGFFFDGASVPWPLTLAIPKTHSLYLGAAALHDHLYSERHAEVSRERSDAIFREAMIVLGLGWIWAGFMWRAVRAGGWMVWYKRKPETPAGRFLRLPYLVRQPLGVVWTLIRLLYGFLVIDLWRLPAYRAEARRIEAEQLAPLTGEGR